MICLLSCNVWYNQQSISTKVCTAFFLRCSIYISWNSQLDNLVIKDSLASFHSATAATSHLLPTKPKKPIDELYLKRNLLHYLPHKMTSSNHDPLSVTTHEYRRPQRDVAMFRIMSGYPQTTNHTSGNNSAIPRRPKEPSTLATPLTSPRKRVPTILSENSLSCGKLTKLKDEINEEERSIPPNRYHLLSITLTNVS